VQCLPYLTAETETENRVFWVNPFLVTPPLVILIIFLKDRQRQGASKSFVKEVDWSGMALISLAFLALLYGFLAGGAVYPWSNVRIIASLVVGGVGVVLFILHQGFIVERFTSARPLMPLRLFSHRTSATGYTITLLHSLAASAFLNFYFIYVSTGQSWQRETNLGNRSTFHPSFLSY
jgi:hypothetical protein